MGIPAAHRDLRVRVAGVGEKQVRELAGLGVVCADAGPIDKLDRGVRVGHLVDPVLTPVLCALLFYVFHGSD